MKYRIPVIAALSLAVAVAIAAPVVAQEWTGKAPTAAQQQALDAARAKLDAAAKDYAELARQYGIERQAFDIQRRLLRKPVIGVVLAPDAKAGVHIAGVTPGSAADAAGLKSGDRIIAIDSRTLDSANPEARVELARAAIGKHDDKTRMQLRYLRDGREQTVVVAPKAGERMMFLPGLDGMEFGRNMEITQLPDGVIDITADSIRGHMPAIAPEVRREIIRLGPDGACKGERCRIPVIAEAMRWNGLNLASVDTNLGKYFGTDNGVLVLSTGPELDGLQPGDVIRSVDGEKVDSPREVMDALRGRETGSKVAVGYLRDRQAGTAQITVPEPMQFRIPAPPAPPAPPPAMAMPAPPAPPAPPAAPLPPPRPGAAMAPQALQPRSIEKRRVVIVDDDGKMQAWEDDGSAPLPPSPPVAPPPPPPPAPPVD